MGFRFQKRIKILPGVTINLSKSGVSTSLGVRGARVTLGHGKTRTTVGLPGTGLSYTNVAADKSGDDAEAGYVPTSVTLFAIAFTLLLVWLIFG